MSYQSALSVTEQGEEAYIEQEGENREATIVECWLDEFKLRDDRAAIDNERRLALLRERLLHALRCTCTELELAENAARMVGGPDFDTWIGDWGMGVNDE